MTDKPIDSPTARPGTHPRHKRFDRHHRQPRQDQRPPHALPPPNGREWLYGRQPVKEMLAAARRTVYRIFTAGNIRQAQELDALLHAANQAAIPISELPPSELDRLADGGNHQGIVAETAPYPYFEFAQLTDQLADGSIPQPLLLILDHIQDPQNLGALLRSAECAGVHAVCIPSNRATGVTPSACRASAGAAEHMHVCKVTNISETLRRLKKLDVWIAGLESTPLSTDVANTDLTGPIALVVGSEADGLQRLVRETCDYLVKIPMLGKVASLNAATAGAIALFEIQRQRAVANLTASPRRNTTPQPHASASLPARPSPCP